MEKHIVRSSRVWLAGLFAISAVLSASAGRADEKASASAGRADEDDQVLQGFEIAPVTLNMAGKNRALVGLGSYLVNTTGCNDCHTHPNWASPGNPYMGEKEQINTAQYLTGGRTFGLDMTVYPAVPIVSANLTPDEKTGKPAGLTLDQFMSVMRTGKDPDDHSRLLKVMPWPLYQWKTDRDLKAMYEYLRAIPSLPDNPNQGP
jgi:hypothetical protein